MLIDNFELVSYCEHIEVTLRSLTVEIDIIGCLDVFELPFREIATDEVGNRFLDKNGGSCALLTTLNRYQMYRKENTNQVFFDT